MSLEMLETTKGVGSLYLDETRASRVKTPDPFISRRLRMPKKKQNVPFVPPEVSPGFTVKKSPRTPFGVRLFRD